MSTGTVSSYAGWMVPGFTERRELGRGGSGRVVEAVHDASGRRVAIRYLSPALLSDPAFVRGFRAEARILAELGAPQVVRVYDFVEQPGHGAAIVTELVSGISLATLIERDGPLSPEAALVVLKSTLLALAAAHAAGLAHRDCKPRNVLLDAAGNGKLADFGVAVQGDRRLPVAGAPLYLAPERWHGAPAGPAADVYAATAVFFECLAGRPPFAGELPRLREQHAAARVPFDQVEPPLQEIVRHGLAKNPAARPSAVNLASGLESAASAAYGPHWEERGRRDLADRAAAALPSLAGDHGAAPAKSHRLSRSIGGRKRRVLGIAAIATAAVLLIGGVATAVTLKQSDHGHDAASLSGSSPQLMAVKPSFTAVANVTPPVAAARCTTPTTFSYSGTLSAATPGTVRYQWAYSSGKPGPVRTVRFTRAGHQLVAGQTVAARTASTGWGEIKLISPVAKTSGKATYRLLCGGSSVGGVTVTVAVTPAARTARCVPAPPDFAVSGSIRAAKAETVTYYWAQSDGVDSAPATLTFHRPGTLAVEPLAIAPPGTSGTGEAVLVVTSPVTAASRPAAYTLTCETPVITPGAPTAPATAPSSPASSTHSPGSSSALSVSVGTMRPTAVYGEPWTGTATVSGGKGPYTWSVTGLPPGLTATPNDGKLTISGSPTALGDFSLGFSAKDSSSPAQTATNSFDFPVTDEAMAVSVNGSATATRGQSYSATVTATGGDGTFVWDTTSMEAGMTATAHGATLTISGTPQTLGEYTAGGTVSDDGSPPQVLHWSLPITTNPAPLAVTGSAPTVAEVGQPYLATLTATGGTGSFDWTPANLAPGLTGTANGATFTISGTPTTAGSYLVVVLVASGAQPSSGKTFTLVVSP